jgi:hypothetical protein
LENERISILKKADNKKSFQVMNVDQLEEMNDNSNPFKIMRNKIKIERLIEKNHDEVFID